MAHTMGEAFRANFLGNSPTWYKFTILGFLIVNPILVLVVNQPFLAGWVLVLQFIFTLAMALKCYPLQPGGLLAVEAIVLGLATPEMVFHEAEVNFPVIMLLMFMVAGIYFLREFLLFTFTKILLGVRSKMLLSLMFSFTAAFLSAFLDALTVAAVIISVAIGFYGIYHKVASGKQFHHSHDASDDEGVIELHREDLERFRAFLRNLMMHGAVGTALGGVTTLVRGSSTRTSASSAPGSIRSAPLLERMTGSSTTGTFPACSSSAPAIASMIAAEKVIPIFTAASGK